MRSKIVSVVIGAFLLLIFGSVWRLEYRSRIEANKIFGNMTYLTNSPYFSEDVSLVNGRYDWNHTSEDDVFVFYHLRYSGRYVYGDFNRDGLRDAAVIITECSGGNSDENLVAFLINDGKMLVHKTSGYLGDRTIIRSVRAHGGKVSVEMFVHQDRDCMAGPTCHVIDTFEYNDHERWLDGKRISVKSIFDPFILMLQNPSSLLDLPSWSYVLQRCNV